MTIPLVAGVSALLSPCGYPMLPGYISYYLGSEISIDKAVRSGVACTLGLLSVFSAIGIAAVTVGSIIYPYIPLLELVAGVAVIIMGITLIWRIRLPNLFTSLRPPMRKGLIGIFLYGVVYGLAAMGCSAPIFFSILFFAVVSGGVLSGILTFVVYALGMGFPIIVTTILVAKAKTLMLKKITAATPFLQKISGGFLVAIGIYLIYSYLTLLAI